MKVFSSKRIALKVDELKYRKIYCLQARQCINQPGNFTGWGSEDQHILSEMQKVHGSFGFQGRILKPKSEATFYM